MTVSFIFPNCFRDYFSFLVHELYITLQMRVQDWASNALILIYIFPRYYSITLSSPVRKDRGEILKRLALSSSFALMSKVV